MDFSIEHGDVVDFPYVSIENGDLTHTYVYKRLPEGTVSFTMLHQEAQRISLHISIRIRIHGVETLILNSFMQL